MFSTKTGAAKLALLVVIGLITFKAIVAFLTGSISIIAQTVDSFLDLIAISLIGFAITVASRPADEEHPFAHGKVEGIAAGAQAAMIAAAGGWIIYSAFQRIIAGSEIELTEAGMGIMLVSIVVSIFLSRHLLKVARATSSIALEAAAHNIAADVYSAAGVLVALTAIRFSGLNILDPIVALGVSLLILKAAYDVLKKSFGELVDVRLPKEEEDAILASITEHTSQLAGFHKVRTRRAGSQRFIDLHLMMPRNVGLEEAHQMCDHLETDISTKFPDSSVTIHVEPCDGGCNNCQVSTCSLRLGVRLEEDVRLEEEGRSSNDTD
ncbi:MAG: cation diffusion facilitator family transporter [Dehalococcoidales bacterium]|nr:cation diffusion facilitator family transporter [Dehalococcoidales bacterium]